MTPPPQAIAAVAAAGPWTLDGLTDRLTPLRGWRNAEEIGDVVALLLGRWPTPPDAEQTIVAAVVARMLAERPGIRPRRIDDAPHPDFRWPVAPWADLTEAAHALDVDLGELAWFADPGGWLRRTAVGPLQHYRHCWVPAASGVPRLLETPKPRLAELQRRVGRHVLAAIPVHDAAHGFVRGRSPLTLAARHSGRPMVLRFDLEGFFSHVTGARVAGLLRTAGYPETVATTLAGLLVTATPWAVLAVAPPADPALVETRRRLLTRLAGPHLPQGAPTSPAVANLLAYRLDQQLSRVARDVGATYGRYADDLVFSGPSGLPVAALTRRVARIAAAEGFRLRPDKTRVLPAHVRQLVTGVVVNATPGVSRRDYDDLRALLHNCARTGPAAQNRLDHPAFREHLRGRIAWVASGRPARARTLERLFAAIRWE